MNTNSMQLRLRAKWVTYKEVPLWCCDFGGFGADRAGLQAEIAASQAVIDQQPDTHVMRAVKGLDHRHTHERGVGQTRG